jgi:hypothetical protein
MDGIADFIGRGACGIIGGFIPICATGQSVATIGYGTIALIVIVAAAWVASRRSK